MTIVKNCSEFVAIVKNMKNDTDHTAISKAFKKFHDFKALKKFHLKSNQLTFMPSQFMFYYNNLYFFSTASNQLNWKPMVRRFDYVNLLNKSENPESKLVIESFRRPLCRLRPLRSYG